MRTVAIATMAAGAGMLLTIASAQTATTPSSDRALVRLQRVTQRQGQLIANLDRTLVGLRQKMATLEAANSRTTSDLHDTAHLVRTAQSTADQAQTDATQGLALAQAAKLKLACLNRGVEAISRYADPTTSASYLDQTRLPTETPMLYVGRVNPSPACIALLSAQ